jgi:nucleotide-binding universal stress UspA family protein
MSITPSSQTPEVDHVPGPATKPLVVGVDSSKHAQSAVSWAADEALRAGRRLSMLMVIDKIPGLYPRATVRATDTPESVSHAADILDRLKARTTADHPGLETSTGTIYGSTLNKLLEVSESAEMIVVGKRGLGAFKRMMVGSTSIGLAGRSHVPTVVVPDGWDQAAHAHEAVLVAIDPTHDNDAVLSFAFERALELGVDLVVLHIWDTHPAIVPGADDLTRWGAQANAELHDVIAPWRDKYPAVNALPAARHGHPAQSMLDAASHAQLLVLGRRTSGASPIGFGVGSLTRPLLHYCERPVAVVPSASHS